MPGKRHRNVWAFGAILVVLLGPTGVVEAKGKIPRALVGKVFFSIERIVDQAPPALIRLFAKRKPKIELVRPKAKDSLWKTTLVAFFRKPSVHGPMTLWLYDKADRASIKAKEPVHVLSVNAKGPARHFVHELDINPDLGFNRKHTYIIFVGQIIGKRAKYYAKGEVSLK